MSSDSTVVRRRRLGDVLVERGVVTEEQLDDALSAQLEPGKARRRLGRIVVDKGYATERQVAETLADLLGLALVDLGRIAADAEAARLLPRAVAERSRVLVLAKSGSTVRIAASDPTNVVALDDVRAYTGAATLDVVVATDSQIRDHLTRAWSLGADSPGLADIVQDTEWSAPEDADPIAAADQAPTVRLVNTILADAVRAGASDIHIEPQRDGVRVRYRVDGMLRDVMTVPRAARGPLVSRVKIVSGLDIAERRVPQDGRARLVVDGAPVDSRVSTMPTVHGEKIVIRLLASAETVTPLAHLGLDPGQLDTVLAGVLATRGLVLITGPTGSGKTSTLYSLISHIATPDRNVVTLEDPVEIQLTGITQVQTNERTGLTFSRGLRSILRQDPDVILVGEVRDIETAELALQASLTGHQVLTTLHTNDAVGALTRLVDMGAEPFLVASSLTLVVAQRLVRRPCDDCAAPYTPSPQVLAHLGLTDADLKGASPRRGKGCTECGGTGYRGRTGIFEVLPVTAGLRAVLLRSPSEGAIAAAARSAGMTTLRASGLAKARKGETTFEEVLRVTQLDVAGGRSCPTCGRALADDMVACPWCETPVDRGHCSSCARPLDADWRICPWCRTPAPTPEIADSAGVLRPRVLIVASSDGDTRALVRDSLDGAADVDEADTADAALAATSDTDYDAVLVDAHLTDLTGVELLRLLRNSPHTAKLPLMLVQREGGKASSNRQTASAARKAGADDVLLLPVEPFELEERVLDLAGRSPRLSA